MFIITVKGAAETKYPWPEELDGIECQDEFSEYFDKEQKPLIDKGVKNGYLKFEWDSDKLYTVTTYESDKKLTPEELRLLKEYTQGQWSDGIGEGFEQFPCIEGKLHDPYGDGNETKEVYISPWHRKQHITITQEENGTTSKENY